MADDLDPKVRGALASAKRLARGGGGIAGVDYGYAHVGGKLTDQPAIRFHVRRKLPAEQIAPHLLLPQEVDDLPVDVLEIGYRPHAGNPRASQPELSPGISIGNRVTSETGTLGALVRDLTTGDICMLSNWHVLVAQADPAAGEEITQPGPIHAGGSLARTVGQLDRWLDLAEQYDAAIARVAAGVPARAQIFDEAMAFAGVKAPALGQRLAKSGAATGRTTAVVDGVGGSYQLDYTGFGAGPVWLAGFRMVSDPADPVEHLSQQGDSGAVWMDEADGLAVGLHFAGADDDGPLDDVAVAHPLEVVLSRLNVELVT